MQTKLQWGAAVPVAAANHRTSSCSIDAGKVAPAVDAQQIGNGHKLILHVLSQQKQENKVLYHLCPGSQLSTVIPLTLNPRL